MTDYRRMTWQYRANVTAEIVRILCIFLVADEMSLAMRYHFPLWDEVMFVVTMMLHQAAVFVDKYTRMYRIDL